MNLLKCSKGFYLILTNGCLWLLVQGEAGPPEAQRNDASVVEAPHSAAPGPGSMEQHKEDNPLTSMWRHNASSDYDEVVNWFVSHPQRDDKGKPKTEGAVVKTEDAGIHGAWIIDAQCMGDRLCCLAV